MLSRAQLRELIRFGATGFFCLALNTSGVMLLTEIAGLHYLASLTLSSLIVMTVGYLINKYWTFRVDGTAVPPEFVRYVTTNCAAMLVSLWVCSSLVEDLHVPYSWSVVFAGIACAPLTYLTHRAWTFGLSILHSKSLSS